MGSLFNRRVGPLGALIIVAVGIAVTIGIAQLLPKKDEPEKTATATATATAAPTACKALDPPYGSPPQDFTYDAVDESRRAETVKALKLDEADGKVDVLTARQTSSGLSLGEIVGVPEPGPREYASSLIASFQSGGAEVDARQRLRDPAARERQAGRGRRRGCRTVADQRAGPRGGQVPRRRDLQRVPERRRPTRRALPPAEEPVDPRVGARGDLRRRDEPQLHLDRLRVPAARATPRASRRGSRGGRRRRRRRRGRPPARRAPRPAAARRGARIALRRSASRGGRGAAAARSRARRRSAVTLPPSGKISTASRGARGRGSSPRSRARCPRRAGRRSGSAAAGR